MKKISFSVILIFFGFPLLCQEFTFRGFTWGTSIESIVLKEGEPHDIETNGNNTIIRYGYIKVAGAEAILTFTFAKNKLISSEYFIMNNYDDEKRNMAILTSIEKNLNDLYGTPNEKSFVPLSDTVHYWYIIWNHLRTRINFSIQKIGKNTVGHIKYESPNINLYGDL